jgi:isochorismate synthase
MEEYLAYRLPGQKIEKFQGTWKKNDLQSLVNENSHFVFSGFDDTSVFQFVPQKKISNIPHIHLPNTNENQLSQEEYLCHLAGIMDFMKEREIDKIIYSRIKTVERNETDLDSLFEMLCEQYPTAFVYLLNSKENGCWIGASPEVLLRKNKTLFETVALAGTLSDSNAEWSEKEKKEQQFVGDYIEVVIARYTSSFVKGDTHEVTAGQLRHLKTNFQFALTSSDLSNFIEEIHPTPAVCGVPKLEAKQLIQEVEAHKRNLYTGFLGVVGSDDVQLYVNLRCMQCFGNVFHLYVGGGITAESIPENEWIETERKATTLSNVIKKLWN